MTFNRNNQSLSVEEHTALEIFATHKAIIKVVSDQIQDPDGKYHSDYRYFDFILGQIKNPTEQRPSRSAYFNEDAHTKIPDITHKFNLLTQKTHLHHRGNCRFNRHKDTIFSHTAKTSVSLHPTETVMRLIPDRIGMLWNIDECQVKAKYIFKDDADTSSCIWLYDKIVDQDDQDSLAKFKSTFASLAELRAKNDAAVKNKEIIRWNELLVGLPQKISALFATEDTAELRIRAWQAMQHCKKYLQLERDIPVLIVAQGQPIRVYTANDYLNDINHGFTLVDHDTQAVEHRNGSSCVIS